MRFGTTLCTSFIFLLYGIAPASANSPTAAAPPRPNIVIVLADDMGFSDIGCFGGEIRTPNLDALAAGGLRFNNFYNAGRCCPSRASLLTGQYPHQAGVGWMTSKSMDLPGYHDNLSRDAVTIAEVLRGAGYSTYMCGKWHVSRSDVPTGPDDNWPTRRGFDRFYGTNKGGAGYFDPQKLYREDTLVSAPSDPEYKPAAYYYYTDAIADQASRFIHEHRQRQAAKPFFLYVAFTAPHWPLHAPAAAVAKYKGNYDGGYQPIREKRFEREKELGIVPRDAELSPVVGNWDQQPDKQWEARCMEVYAAQVELMDAGVGRIVSALRDENQLEQTLVLFLSDNGGCAEKMGREASPVSATTRSAGGQSEGVHPPFTRDGRPIHDGKGVLPGPDDTFIAYGQNWANVSNTPFRRYKHWVHEGGIATPLIAHWPGGISRHGEIEHQPGHIIDVMPTCVALAGATYPERFNAHVIKRMQGVSLLPAYRGEPIRRQSPLFWEHEGNRAMRSGRWKLVAKGADGPWELYDLDTDRSELHDLAAAQRSVLKNWRRRGSGGPSRVTCCRSTHSKSRRPPDVLSQAIRRATTIPPLRCPTA
jgi:arylsulfatase